MSMEKEINSIVSRIKAIRKPNCEPEYECPDCKDVGFIICNDNGHEYAKPCKCKEMKEAKERLLESGISEEDLNKGFNDFKTFNEDGLQNAKDKAISYYSNFEKIKGNRINSILLSGASGRGKTTLGFAVANNLMKRKSTSVLYMPYREEITALKQLIIDEAQYNSKMNKFKNASVLFIDDLFKGRITESDLNIAYEIINFRYIAKLPMIVSTEKTMDELMAFDEAVAGRIIEMSKDYIITFGKEIPNYRLRS